MNHIFQIKGKLELDLLDQFTECVNQDYKKIIIYLNCTGGSAVTHEVMADMINKNPERFELIAVNGIFSSGFMLFFDSKCAKRIMPGTLGMIHQGWQDISLNDNQKPAYDVDKAYHTRMKKHDHPDGLNFIKRIGLNKKEIKKYKKGHDVYFQPDRLLEIFNNQSK